MPKWQQSGFIAFGSWLVIVAAIIVAADSGFVDWEFDGTGRLISKVVLAVVFIFGLSATLANFRLPAMESDSFPLSFAFTTRRRSALFFLVLLLLYGLLQSVFIHKLTLANRIPTFWRSVHVLSGVSALLPQLFLVGGMYCWFWFCLRGLALFGDDRPQLPKQADLPSSEGKPILQMFSHEYAEKWTDQKALPFGKLYLLLLGPTFLLTTITGRVLLGKDFALRTFGELAFGVYMFIWVALCISLILADTAQAWSIWTSLRELLIDLDCLPLRRTLDSLRGLSWRSIWAMSGNVLRERYLLLSRQIEALRHLNNQVSEWIPVEEVAKSNKSALLEKIRHCQTKAIPTLAGWYQNLDDRVDSVEPMHEIQAEIASIAALALTAILIPSWRTEKHSLIFDRSPRLSSDHEKSSGPVISEDVSPLVLAAEEFFVLPYVGFIQNVLGRIRTIVLGSLFLFVATTLAVSSYPFDPLPVLAGIFLVVFLITLSVIITMYAGMHRDASLSYITGTKPGELGWEFWRQLLTFGIGPLLGLLTTLFPSLTDFVISWLQPSSQAMK